MVAMCFVDFLAQTLRSPERVLLSPMGPFLSPTFLYQHKEAPWGTLLNHDLQIKILAGQGTQALRPFLLECLYLIKPPRLTFTGTAVRLDAACATPRGPCAASAACSKSLNRSTASISDVVGDAPH